LEKTLIVDLPNTTTAKIGKKLQELRETGGVVALGRVLSLLVETDAKDLENAIAIANGASKLHPSRIIVIARNPKSTPNLDAEIRVGGDAGASEVIVLRASGEVLSSIESLVNGLLLPDAPIVSWSLGTCSSNPGASELGQIAGRRITDSAAQPNPVEFLTELARNYTPGDGDMAWTRITLWRSQLAALMDAHSNLKARSAIVFGAKDSPSAHLFAKWIELKLGVTTQVVSEYQGASVSGVGGLEIQFDTGSLSIQRQGQIGVIRQPDQPESTVYLPQRSDLDCLVEDLRFLGEDLAYSEVLRALAK
jgi:glucose-6-phosphate dehydrogenase assembly protein OpcA